jgi:predicted Zn-dependent protease
MCEYGPPCGEGICSTLSLTQLQPQSRPIFPAHARLGQFTETSLKQMIVRRIFAALLSLSILAPLPAHAQAKRNSVSLIRDAEIEGLLRLMTKPILKAAGLSPGAVKVYLIADDRINAFVSNGQNIFVHTGLITKTKTPNEVIGVLAHETGHVAGGHLAQLDSELARASAERIVGMLLGVAAVVGGSVAGNQDAARAGQGIMMGSQGMAARNFLSYQRSMEASADQAALKYLKATKQSAGGMLTLFGKLANETLASTQNADPYLFSHPMPFDRIRNLEVQAKQSPYYDKPDSAGILLRYDLARAKLAGFMQSPQKVFQRYPSSNKSLASRYARSIAMFRRGDIKNALPIIDSLTSEVPENPYFWELKAQALLENGQAANGLPAIKKARALLPDNGLLQVMHAQILIGAEQPAAAKEAVSLLRLAKKTEGDMPAIYKYMATAYAISGDNARADLAAAEYAWLTGDKDLAVTKAKLAQERFPKATPEWLRANDLLTFASRKKK